MNSINRRLARLIAKRTVKTKKYQRKHRKVFTKWPKTPPGEERMSDLDIRWYLNY